MCVCVSGEQRQIRYAVGDLPLSLLLSVIMGKRMETKRKLLAISHQHIFFNYSSVLSALLGHVFSSCCWPPTPLLLTVVAAVVVALFSFVPDPSRFAWRRFARKKENKESREMTEADGRAAAAYRGEAEYPCHRAYI